MKIQTSNTNDQLCTKYEADTKFNNDHDSIQNHTQLKNEFVHFKQDTKSELQQLQERAAQLAAQVAEVSSDEIGNWEQLRQELGSLFSASGYSKLLGTRSLFHKLFWLFCFAWLVYGCGHYVLGNVAGYLDYEVITQIKMREDASLNYPAVSLCFHELSFAADLKGSNLTDLGIGQVLYHCFFEYERNLCSVDDFEPVVIDNPPKGTQIRCYKFNGGESDGLVVLSYIWHVFFSIRPFFGFV